MVPSQDEVTTGHALRSLILSVRFKVLYLAPLNCGSEIDSSVSCAMEFSIEATFSKMLMFSCLSLAVGYLKGTVFY
jgi:hypothetical protein